MNRFISIHLPDGYSGSEPLLLLIAFHGAGALTFKKHQDWIGNRTNTVSLWLILLHLVPTGLKGETVSDLT